jgi:hypothetical protein
MIAKKIIAVFGFTKEHSDGNKQANWELGSSLATKTTVFSTIFFGTNI